MVKMSVKEIQKFQEEIQRFQRVLGGLQVRESLQESLKENFRVREFK